MATIDTLDTAACNFVFLDEDEVFCRPLAGVYFVQSFFDTKAPIKIGYAKNIGRRYEAIQCANPEELCIRLICKTPTPKELENFLHKRFSHLRIRGEWFEKTGELARFIEYPDREWQKLGQRFIEVGSHG